MKNVLYFLAGVMFIMLVSATTVSVMTVKPQMPKETLVKAFRDRLNIEENVSKFIISKAHEGYIVKTVTMTDDGYQQRAIIILEKY